MLIDNNLYNYPFIIALFIAYYTDTILSMFLVGFTLLMLCIGLFYTLLFIFIGNNRLDKLKELINLKVESIKPTMPLEYEEVYEIYKSTEDKEVYNTQFKDLPFSKDWSLKNYNKIYQSKEETLFHIRYTVTLLAWNTITIEMYETLKENLNKL